MRLIPYVVLLREDDMATLEQFASQIVVEQPSPEVAVAMRLNGWTTEMVRMSRFMHALCEFLRSGDVEVVVEVGEGP